MASQVLIRGSVGQRPWSLAQSASKFNDLISQQLPIYHETVTTIAATVFRNVADKERVTWRPTTK